MIRTVLSGAALAACFALPAMAHGPTLPITQQAAPVAITSTDLGNGIHFIQGKGGNIGLLTGPDGAFVIDSQFANIAPDTLAKIQELSGESPRFLINTHWHGDHTGGNEAYRGAGATIVAHDNVRGRLKVGNERSPASPVAALPVVTFSHKMAFHLNGQTIKVMHLPGAHTDGDAMVMFKEANTVHMGDVMFSGMFPYIDRGSGGSLEGYIMALDAAHAMTNDATVVIPGHGPVSTRADIKALADMLRDVRGRITPMVAEGMSMDEVVNARPLADLADKWATGFMTEERFTTIIFEDVSGAPR